MDIALIRKEASLERGRRFFSPETKAPSLSVVALAEIEKMASADKELLTLATFLRPEDPFGMYEELGGGYTPVGKGD
jgi:hypothetical protein